jgi:anti-anti-sigma factor
VRLHGHYDVGAVAELSELLSSAIAFDDADLVLDMDEVSFIDAAAMGVVIRARSFLQLRSRSLTLRS